MPKWALRTAAPVVATLVGACGTGGSQGAQPASEAGAADSPMSVDEAGAEAGTEGGADGKVADAPSCVSTASVYVAPNGAGTACSCASPCALETGRDKARALTAGATSDVVVEVEDGTYRLAHTFALDATNSGPGGGHVTVYRAAPGASPVWSGALRVQGFAPVDAQMTVWVASVPAGTHSRQLYVNGRRATRARGPDAPAGYTKTSAGFTLGDAAMASWPDRSALEVVGTYQWQMYRCPVTSVDVAAGIALATPCWSYGQSESFSTVAWFENALELLDTGGEFFLDDAAGKLYYAPRAGEDLTQADVELPTLEGLVSGTGTPAAPLHDVAFEGITFAHATWLGPSSSDGYVSLQATITTRGSPAAQQKPLANVTMHGAHGVRFTSCAFEHLGGAALAFEVGAQSNLVDGCVFEDVSASAVMVGDVTHTDDHHPTDPTLIVKDNTVERSYVTRAGAEYYDACGIFVGYTTHTTVASNELFDLPYTGISAGWGWGSVDPGGSGGYTTPSTSQDNDIEKNVVSHHMRALRDGGGIYVLGAQPGAVMNGNVISNQGNAYGNLYLDNGSQHWTVSSDVVLVDPKQDVAQPDPDRSYWTYVQVFAPLATNNTITGAFTNDAMLFTPQPIDPSNSIAPPTVLTNGDLSPAASIVNAAGTPLRSPEIAAGKASSASSEYDSGHTAALGNDDNAYDGWSPSGTDTSPWWQVDLGGAFAIDAVEVVSRWAIDQPVTRRSYRVIASNDPTFASPTVLGSVDATGLPHRAIFATTVQPAVTARYVRVEKTAAEYFFIGEVRVHGK
jgi:hypothetical protein